MPEWLDPRSHFTKGGRVRLYGDDYTLLRVESYTAAQGICQCGCGQPALFIPRFEGDPDAGDFAHNEHGSRKSDELHRGKWKRRECHMNSHNAGGKPCPKKPEAA